MRDRSRGYPSQRLEAVLVGLVLLGCARGTAQGADGLSCNPITRFGQDAHLSPDSWHANDPTGGWSGTQYLFAWPASPALDYWDIYLRRADADGNPLGSVQRFSPWGESIAFPNQSNPHLAWGSGRFGMTFGDARAGDLSQEGLYFVALDESGAQLSPERLIQANQSVTAGAQIIAADDGFTLAWIHGGTVWFARVDPSGNILVPATALVASPAAAVSIAWNGIDYAVVWNNLQFLRVDRTGSPIGTPLTVPTSHMPGNASMTWNGTHYGVAYSDVYTADGNTRTRELFRLLDRVGVPIGPEQVLTDIPDPVGGQIDDASITSAGGQFAVAWPQQSTPELPWEVYFQTIEPWGVPIGAPIQVSNTPGGTGSFAAVPIWQDGQYGIVYTQSFTAPPTLDRSGATLTRLGCSAETFETIDPNPFLLDGPDVADDPMTLAGGARAVTKAAADGVTRVLLRYEAPRSGTVTFRLKDETGGSNEIGELRSPGGTESSQTSLATSTTNVDGVDRAYAVWVTPRDFVRSSSDESAATRGVRIEVEHPDVDPNTSQPATFWENFELVRPPVVLLHGLWSSSTDAWGKPGTGWELKTDPRFDVSIEDYHGTAGASFSSNRIVPKRAIYAALGRARDRGTAVTQVDLIGHSMGGVLTRIQASNRYLDYLRADNFGSGDLHKLITLDTPHAGSQLADYLTHILDHCQLTDILLNLLKRGGIDDVSAAYDLRVSGPEIAGLPATVGPAHSVDGLGGSEMNLVEFELRARNTIEGRLWNALQIFGFTQAEIFNGDAHDGIVPQSSQLGGLSGPSADALHYSFFDPTKSALHTSVAKEPQGNDLALSLLNARIADSNRFAPGFPAPGPPLFANPTTCAVRRGGLHSRLPSLVSTFHPGDDVTVIVEPDPGYEPVKVAVSTSFDSMMLNGPPFTGTIHIPQDAVGSYVIDALSVDADGGVAQADPLTIQVQVPSSLVSLRIEPDPVYLFSFAPSVQLRVLGTYADGIERDISSPSLGTTYQVYDERSLSVSSGGLVTALRAVNQNFAFADNGALDAYAEVHIPSAPLNLEVWIDGVEWQPQSDADGYDIARGRLSTLHATGGNFSVSTDPCLASRTQDTFAEDLELPPPGDGFWYVMRIRYGDFRGVQSYDSGAASQVASRDAGINASAGACP